MARPRGHTSPAKTMNDCQKQSSFKLFIFTAARYQISTKRLSRCWSCFYHHVGGTVGSMLLRLSRAFNVSLSLCRHFPLSPVYLSTPSPPRALSSSLIAAFYACQASSGGGNISPYICRRHTVSFIPSFRNQTAGRHDKIRQKKYVKNAVELSIEPSFTSPLAYRTPDSNEAHINFSQTVSSRTHSVKMG